VCCEDELRVGQEDDREVSSLHVERVGEDQGVSESTAWCTTVKRGN
jgi:hypothetical protein